MTRPDDLTSAPLADLPADLAPPPPLWKHGLLLLLLSAVLLTSGLGDYPLIDQDESRYGQIPREMLEADDWVTPRMFGTVYTDKPPLQYWQVMISFKLFGRNEFAARLPVVLAALATILAVFWLTARAVNRRAGWIACLCLTTMLFFFVFGRFLVLDGVLSAYTILAAVMVFANLPRPPELPPRADTALIGRRSLVRSTIGYVFLGLATLVKGPVAGILFGMPFVLFYIWRDGFQWLWSPRLWWRMVREMHLWLGIPLTVAVVLPWFLCMEKANPGFLHEFFVVQNLRRYLTDEQSRNQPFFIFFAVAIAGLFPWITFVPGAIWRFLRADGWRRLPVTHPVVAFAMLLAVFPILFFSTSHSKLIPYIAPCFPGFAILLGAYFSERIGNPELHPPPRIAALVLSVTAFVLGIAPLLYAVIVAYDIMPVYVRLGLPALVCFSLPMLVLCGLLLLHPSARTTAGIVRLTAVCMTAFLGLATLSGITQTVGAGASHAALMERVEVEQHDDPRPLVVFKQHDQQASYYFYHPRWPELIKRWSADGEEFYKPLEFDLIAWKHSRVLINRKDLKRFMRHFGATFRITTMHEIGNSFELAVDYVPPSEPTAKPPAS